MKFVLEIEMGNAAVSDNYDIAGLLLKVHEKLLKDNDSGKIMDYNGNCVGKFGIVEDE